MQMQVEEEEEEETKHSADDETVYATYASDVDLVKCVHEAAMVELSLLKEDLTSAEAYCIIDAVTKFFCSTMHSSCPSVHQLAAPLTYHFELVTRILRRTLEFDLAQQGEEDEDDRFFRVHTDVDRHHNLITKRQRGVHAHIKTVYSTRRNAIVLIKESQELNDDDIYCLSFVPTNTVMEALVCKRMRTLADEDEKVPIALHSIPFTGVYDCKKSRYRLLMPFVALSFEQMYPPVKNLSKRNQIPRDCDIRRMDTMVRKHFVQLAEAIQWLHRNNIAHRDIRTANIRFTESGDLRLLDFDSACVGSRTMTIARRETVPITQVYARAIELFYIEARSAMGGPTDYDAKAVDVWSLGVVLFALLYHGEEFLNVPVEQIHETHVEQIIIAIEDRHCWLRFGLEEDEYYQWWPEWAKRACLLCLEPNPAKRATIYDVLSDVCN